MPSTHHGEERPAPRNSLSPQAPQATITFRSGADGSAAVYSSSSVKPCFSALDMLLSLLLLPLMHASASTRFVNVTIDNTHGDARTGIIPAYSSEGHWNAICPGCGAVDVPLDWAQVEQRTMFVPRGTFRYCILNEFPSSHDAVVNSTIGKANVTLKFNGEFLSLLVILFRIAEIPRGSAIYVFFAILPMFDMQVEFYLDSSPRPAETLIWFANTTATDVIYDHLVFKSGTLADAEHTLLISCAQEGNFGTIALFDYALYTCVRV